MGFLHMWQDLSVSMHFEQHEWPQSKTTVMWFSMQMVHLYCSSKLCSLLSSNCSLRDNPPGCGWSTADVVDRVSMTALHVRHFFIRREQSEQTTLWPQGMNLTGSAISEHTPHSTTLLPPPPPAPASALTSGRCWSCCCKEGGCRGVACSLEKNCCRYAFVG